MAAAPPALTRGERAQRRAAGSGEQWDAGPQQQDAHGGHGAPGTTRPARLPRPAESPPETPRAEPLRVRPAHKPASRDRAPIARSVLETGAGPGPDGRGRQGQGLGRESWGGRRVVVSHSLAGLLLPDSEGLEVALRPLSAYRSSPAPWGVCPRVGPAPPAEGRPASRLEATRPPRRALRRLSAHGAPSATRADPGSGRPAASPPRFS